MEKLKPCPWCGEEPTINTFGIPTMFYVCCSGIEICDVLPCTEDMPKKKDAIKAWNTRKEAA